MSLKFIEPMYARAVEKLPEGRDWIYEIKLDGYRALAGRDSEIRVSGSPPTYFHWSIVAAPKLAVSEVARTQVDTLIESKRLTVDAVRIELARAGSQSARCLEIAVAWLLGNPASYTKPSKLKLPPSPMSA